MVELRPPSWSPGEAIRRELAVSTALFRHTASHEYTKDLLTCLGEALRCIEGEVDTYSCPCKGTGSQPAALAMLQVLGTLITEWAAGALKCLELFATASLAELFAAQLSKLMAHYGFDGWLINIENPVLRFLLPNVLHFLR